MGLVQVLNNTQLDEKEKKEAVIKKEVESTTSTNQPVLSALASHIRGCWLKAQDAKRDIEQQFLRNMRQKKGEYEPSKLAAIRSMKSSEIFLMITDVKCRNFKDWVKDVLFQPGSRCWGIEPTPLPDVPEWIENSVYAAAMKHYFEEVQNQAMQTGQQIPVEIVGMMVKENMPDILDEVQKAIQEKSKEIVEKMEDKIDDQLTEGGFYKALEECIPDIACPGEAIIKGPTFRKEKVKKLVGDPATGKVRVEVQEKIIPQYERVSPFDIYPAPDSNDIDDGFLIEKTSLTGTSLSSLIGVPGYSEEAIRRVLVQYNSGGLREWTAIDTERAEIERKNTSQIWDSDKVDCLVFWGEVQGSVLLEWGMKAKDVPDPDIYHNICAWLVGTEVIKAMLNPDPLGKKPYSKAAFDDSNGGFWGCGLPEKIVDAQAAANASARALVNNVGIASGPLVEVNTDRITGDTSLYPWKVFQSTNDQMSQNTPAMRVYSIQMVSVELMNVLEKWAKIADEHSGVPAYAHGDENVGGAGNTASGLSMLMTSAARGIKGVIKSIDTKIIAPTVERQYYLNIDKVENASLVGDYKVVARGSSSLIAKEQQSMRRNEFMRATQNPIDLQIMGAEGRRYLLKDTAKSLELDVDKVVPEATNIPPAATPPGVVPPPGTAPATLNAAGEPVAGQDFNLQKGGANAPAG